MLQLVGPRVRVLSTMGRKHERTVYDEAEVRERWGVEPAQIADVLALMGDSIDNIPGVPGVGQKTAAKLIGQFGSVERLYENLPLVPGKLRETLAANRKQALLSRELATVSTRVPVEVDLDAFRRAEPDWPRAPRALDGARVPHPPAPAPGARPRRRRRGPGDLADDGGRSRATSPRVPAGEALAVDTVWRRRPARNPCWRALGLFHPGGRGPASPIASPLWGGAG